jgi:hypothetical protein
MRFANARHTGVTTASPALLGAPSLAWSRPTGNCSAATDKSGVITRAPSAVVMCGAGYSLANGAELFSYAGTSATQSTPAIGGSGAWFVAGVNGGLANFSTTSGALI